MTTKAAAPKAKQSVETPRTGAVLFELENLLIHGHHVEFQILKSVLGEKDIKITPLQFARYCLDKPSRDFVPALLAAEGKTRLSPEKIEEELEAAGRKSLETGKHTPPAPLVSLFAEAQKRGHVLGALSSWDKETAVALLGRLNVDIPRSSIFSCREHWHSPGVDGWLRLSRTVGVSPSRCLCLVSSNRSCRAAINAGMPCVVLPDEYTSFQDYTGADAVIDTLAPRHVDEILALMERR